MTPAVGARARMLPLRGVASPEMRAHVGLVGQVEDVRGEGERVRIAVRFPDREAYWLNDGEWEVAD